EPSCENTQATEDHAQGFRKQLMAPVLCGTQRLMPRQGRPAAAREQPQTIIETLRNSTHAEGVDATRRHLDGERNPVEFAADVGNDRRVRITQIKTIETGRRALDEKLYCWKSERFRSGKLRRVRWKAERWQAHNHLALRSQRLSAGDQNAYQW